MSKNPRVVIDAFVPDVLALKDIILRPISAGTLLILEKINSPLVDDKIISAARKNKGKFQVELSNDDIVRIIFILTRRAKECKIILNRGIEAFDNEVYDYLDRIPAADLPQLGALINRHFENAFSTIIGGSPEQSRTGGDDNRSGKKNDLPRSVDEADVKSQKDPTHGTSSPAMTTA